MQTISATQASWIPLGKVFHSGLEKENLNSVLDANKSKESAFIPKCHRFLENHFATKKALLTPSCTAALEMAALLFDIQPGDEVILPSYTFVSTANAFLLRGAKLVFVDIKPDTLCLDAGLLKSAITAKTKVIVPVHYGGNSCDMDHIMAIAAQYQIFVVEDAAQGFNAMYRGRHLGTIGHLGTFSFHETKNITCGEGGALLINEDRFLERAEIIREKGTDRSRFLRGEAQRYTWQDIGSSFLPSEFQAGFLFGQFESLNLITDKRKKLFNYYQNRFSPLRNAGLLQLPPEIEGNISNHHLYYLILNSEIDRNHLMTHLENHQISSAFHFLPLHLSPMGLKMGGAKGQFPITEALASRILRIPAYTGMNPYELARVADCIEEYFYQKTIDAHSKQFIRIGEQD